MRGFNWIQRFLTSAVPRRRGNKRFDPESLTPQLTVKRLENRRVLNADAAPVEVLLVDAGADANDGQADTIQVEQDSGEFRVFVNGEQTVSRSADGISAIHVQGSSDNDVLVADLMAGVELTFDGGDGNDTLRLASDTPADEVGYSFTGASGRVAVDYDGGAASAAFTNVESITDSLRAESRALQLTEGGSLTLTSPNDRADTTRVSVVSAAEDFALSVDFATPAKSLQINTTGEHSESVAVAGYTPGEGIDLQVLGDSADALSFRGESNITGGVDVSTGAISFDSTGRLAGNEFQFTASESIDLSESAELHSDGGRIEFSAPEINLNGRVSSAGGAVVADSGDDGVTLLSGQVDVSNLEHGGVGGTVHLLGKGVGVLDGATVDASGHAGGGTVLVGGAYAGGDPLIRNAQAALVESGATIRADATAKGSGGRVIVWSDVATHFSGSITARGVGAGGDGGFVETSGKVTLRADGSVDASSEAGSAGTWLLDPRNVELRQLLDNGVDDSVRGAFSLGVLLDFLPSNLPPLGLVAEADIFEIVDALEAGTSVSIVTTAPAATGTGLITIFDAIEVDLSTTAGAQDVTLTLIAEDGITSMAPISLVGADDAGDRFSLVFNAATDVAVTAAIDLTDATGGGGDFTSSGVAFNNTATITTDGGAVSINHTGDVAIDAAITTGGGAAAVSGLNLAFNAELNAGTGDVNLSAGAAITDAMGDDTTTDITAASLTVSSATTIGSSDTDALNLSVDSLAISSSDGAAFLTEADGLDLGVVDVSADDDLSIRTILGSITDADNDSAVTANNLMLTASEDGASIGAAGAATDINVTLTGSLAATASTGAGGVFISGTGDMQIAFVDSGTGDVELSASAAITDNAGANISVGGAATISAGAALTLNDDGADVLNVTGGIDLSGTTITVGAAGMFTAGPITFNSAGAVVIQEDDAIEIAGVNTAGSLSLSTTGDITDAAGASVDVTGHASFDSVPDLAITLDDTLRFGSLSFDGGDVIIVEEDGMTLAGVSDAATATLSSTTGAIDDDGTAVVDVAGNASFDSVADLAITLNDTLRFGTLTFDGGAVTIVEEDGMTLTGASDATSATLSSTTGAINDDGTAVVDVAGNASFDSVADLAITLNDTLRFGTLTFDGGDVTIVEQDGMTLAGTSDAATATLSSTTGGIDDDGTAVVDVAGNASFDSVSDLAITLNDILRFGSLTFDGGAVNIVEEDGMTLAGTSNATTAALTSTTAGIEDAAGAIVTVTGTTDLIGTFVTLGDAGETIDFSATAPLNVAATMGSIDISEADGVRLGVVTASEDVAISTGGGMTTTANMDITGQNIALTLAADQLLTVNAATSITATIAAGNTTLTADQMTLASTGFDQISAGTTGVLQLRAVENNTALLVGADAVGQDSNAGDGTLALDTTDLGALDQASGEIHFGDDLSRGATTVSNATMTVTLNAPLTIFATTFTFAMAGDALATDAELRLDATMGVTDSGGDDEIVDITATTFRVTQATTIGSSDANALNLSVDTLVIDSSNGAAFLTEANGIGLATVNVSADDNLSLRAIMGDITNSASDVMANDLTLTASGAGAAIGAPGAADDINVTLSGILTAVASNGAGGVFVGETGQMDIALADAGTGDVGLSSTDAIADATAGEAANIVGATATLTSATGIGSGTGAFDEAGDINLDVDVINATNTTSGNVQLREVDSFALGLVDNGGRTVVLDAGMAITDDDAVSSTDVVAGDALLRATMGIGSGGGDLNDPTAINLEVASLDATNSNGGAIQVTDTGNLSLINVENLGGRVVVDATSGMISDGAGGGASVTASDAILRATAGVGSSGSAIMTSVDQVEAFGDAGEVNLVNAGDLAIADVSAVITGVSSTGAVGAEATGGNLMVMETVQSTGDTVGLTAGIDLMVGAAVTAQNDANLLASSALTINALSPVTSNAMAVDAQAGTSLSVSSTVQGMTNASLTAGTDLNVNASGAVTAQTAAATLQAGANASLSGAVTANNDATLMAGAALAINPGGAVTSNAMAVVAQAGTSLDVSDAVDGMTNASLTAGTNLNVNAGGAVTAQTAAATIQAGANASVSGAVTANNDATLTAGAALAINAGGAVTSNAMAVVAQAGTSLDVSDAVDGMTNASLTAGTNLNVNAGGSVVAQTAQAVLQAAANASVSGAVAAATDASVTAGQELSINPTGPVTAGALAAIRGGTNLALNGLVGGGMVDVQVDLNDINAFDFMPDGRLVTPGGIIGPELFRIGDFTTVVIDGVGPRFDSLDTSNNQTLMDITNGSVAVIQVVVFEAAPLSTVQIEIDWREADGVIAGTETFPQPGFPVPPDPMGLGEAVLRQRVLASDLAAPQLDGIYEHRYLNNPDGVESLFIDVPVRVSQLAGGTVNVSYAGVTFQDAFGIETVVRLEVLPTQVAQSVPLPEPLPAEPPMMMGLAPPPADSPVIFVAADGPPLPSTAGVNTQSEERFYELRIVSFDESGDVVETLKLKLNNREYKAITPFNPSRLPDLFRRLPGGRYRIYLIEDGAQRLMIDFVIERIGDEGSPIELPEQTDATPRDLEAPAPDNSAQRSPREGVAPGELTISLPESPLEGAAVGHGRSGAATLTSGGLLFGAALLSDSARKRREARADQRMAGFRRRRRRTKTPMANQQAVES